MKQKEKAVAELIAQVKSHEDTITTENKRKKQLEKSLKEVSDIAACIHCFPTPNLVHLFIFAACLFCSAFLYTILYTVKPTYIEF